MSECTCVSGLPGGTPEPSDGSCPTTGFQKVGVCVPVIVTPFARAGQTVTKCCGEPTVDCRKSEDCNACKVTVTQKVNIKIPIRYQVTACMGETAMDCGGETPCCQ